MFHFHNVDILLKLAACDLLDDLGEMLLRTFEAHGFDYLCKHCHAGVNHDGILRLAFRSGLATEQSEALEGICSALRALNRESSGLLVDREDLRQQTK